MKILIANPGSTSFKCKCYESSDWSVVFEAALERIGEPESALSYRHADKEPVDVRRPVADVEQAIQLILEALQTHRSLDSLAAVGFKTVLAKGVNGCVQLDDSIIRAMQEYEPLAPLHTQIYLTAIRVFESLLPDTPRIGLFETTFHHNIPAPAFTYAIPQRYQDSLGLRKYGFHGASHWSIARYLESNYLENKQSYTAISCHLGGSSSICAIRNGESVDTSMGMSPQCGLPNAKRVGDLDSFALLYLMEKETLSPAAARELLASESGILGISGISGDFRDIQAAMARGSERARLTFDTFAYSVKRYIGEYLAVLNGADFIVFTAGLGQHSPALRRAALENMQNLGIELDEKLNAGTPKEGVISTPNSTVNVLVLPTHEELIVAQQTADFIQENA